MPTINNYTFSEPVFTIPEQSNIVSQVGATAVITITPDPGFVAFAADFSATSFDTTYITNVAFSQSGNNVLCTITLDSSTVMPSNNLTLGLCVSGSPHEVLLTIDGKYSATVGSNVTGNSSETDVPYSKSNARSEFSHILTRTYNAASGYFWGGSNIPSINVVTGNQKYYLINQTPTFDSSNRLTNITYDIGYLFPDKSVSGDVISINVPSTQEIYAPSVEIVSYLFNTSRISANGTTRLFTILGVPTAAFSATLNDGTTTSTIINNKSINSEGRFEQPVSIPPLDIPELYTKTGAPSLIQSNFTQIDTGWSFSNGIASIDGTQTGTSRIKGGLGGASLVAGKTYVVELVANITSCRIEFAGGGNFVLTSTQENINGIVRFHLTATASHTLISILCGTSDVGSISSLSVKEKVESKDYIIELTGAGSTTMNLPNPFTISQFNNVLIQIGITGSPTTINGWPSINPNASLTALSNNPNINNLSDSAGDFIILLDYYITPASGTLNLIKQIEFTDFSDTQPVVQEVNGEQSSVTNLLLNSTAGIVAGSKFKIQPEFQENINPYTAPFTHTVSSVDSGTNLTVTPAVTVYNGAKIVFNTSNGNRIDVIESNCKKLNSTDPFGPSIHIKAKIGILNYGNADHKFDLNLGNIISHTP